MAAMMLGFPDAHELSVDEDGAGVWVEIETRTESSQCPTCGTPSQANRTRHTSIVKACRRSAGHCICRGGGGGDVERGLPDRFVIRGSPRGTEPSRRQRGRKTGSSDQSGLPA